MLLTGALPEMMFRELWSTMSMAPSSKKLLFIVYPKSRSPTGMHAYRKRVVQARLLWSILKPRKWGLMNHTSEKVVPSSLLAYRITEDETVSAALSLRLLPSGW